MANKKKEITIPNDVRDDLLGRPLNLGTLQPTSMAEGLEIVGEILREINNYFSNSPLPIHYARCLSREDGRRGNWEFQIQFDSKVVLVRSPTKGKKEEAKEEKPVDTLSIINKDRETLLTKAKDLGVDISDISEDWVAIAERLDIAQDVFSAEEIIPEITEPKPVKVRVRSILQPNQTRSLGSLSTVLGSLKGKNLDSIANYVSKKNGLEDDE